MRELTGHKVNPANDRLTVLATDQPGSGGAHHVYHVIVPGEPNATTYAIVFQNGPIAEVGVNGLTHEALLAILIDRLDCFQRGPFASKFNAEALWHLQEAQASLLARTKARMAQGIEGTHQIGTPA